MADLDKYRNMDEAEKAAEADGGTETVRDVDDMEIVRDGDGRAVGVSDSVASGDIDQGGSDRFFSQQRCLGSPLLVLTARLLSNDEYDDAEGKHNLAYQEGKLNFPWDASRAQAKATVVKFSEDGAYERVWVDCPLSGNLAVLALSAKPTGLVGGVLNKREGDMGAWYLDGAAEYRPIMDEVSKWATSRDSDGTPALVQVRLKGDHGDLEVLVVRDNRAKFDWEAYYAVRKGGEGRSVDERAA